MTEMQPSYGQPAEYKTTNIRLPYQTWHAAKSVLLDAGGKETLNALIVRLLDEYVAGQKSRKKV